MLLHSGCSPQPAHMLSPHGKHAAWPSATKVRGSWCRQPPSRRGKTWLTQPARSWWCAASCRFVLCHTNPNCTSGAFSSLWFATFTLPWALLYELRLFGYASFLPRKRPYGKHAEPGPMGIDQLVSEVPPPYQTSLLYSVQTGLPSFLAGPVVQWHRCTLTIVHGH